MRTSLIISFSMHIAVIAAGFIVLPDAEKFKVKDVSIPVELVFASDETKLTAKPDEKKIEKPKPKPKEKPKKKPPPKPVKKQTKVEPPPLPKPPEPKVEAPPAPKLKKVAKPPEPEKKKVETKKPPKSVPVPRIRPRFAQNKPKTESKFNSQKIAALLNKLPEDKPDTDTPAPKKPNTKKTKSRFSGNDDRVSASKKDLMRQQIGGCWNTNVGMKDAEKQLVKIKIHLKRDGSLQRIPEVLSYTSDIAADRAVRAIRRCAPYEMFSQKNYNAWNEVVLNFDSSEMFGG